MGNRFLKKPLVMGVLNVTPDSFSDGGKFLDPKKAVRRALEMIEEGADIIDIGGESSGPGSVNVSLKDELKRVIPVVKALNARMKKMPAGLQGREKILISVDTYKAEVAAQAVKAGANMINDVTAFRGDPDMAKTLAKLNIPVVIMYSKDPSARTTRKNVRYKDVVKTVADFLRKQMSAGIKAGIKKENLILDPGMGAFISADPKYSLQLLKRLLELKKLGPLLVGASRKGFIGQILGTTKAGAGSANAGSGPDDRLEGSLACAAIATLNGASILRAHDVKETRRTVDMVYAIMNS
jgi:dihydropteroate synthase